MSEIAEIAAVIRGTRFHFADEDMLQEGLAGALAAAGHEVEREVRLFGGRGRLDLLVDGHYGVEAKIKCPLRQIERQGARYLEAGEVDGMIVVSVTPRHHQIPAEIAGRPVEVVSLASGAL